MPSVVRLAFLVVVACGSGGAVVATAQCSPKTGRQPVLKKDYEDLQRWVNDGHEPWRMDANAVAAEALLKFRDASKDEWDVYRVNLKTVQETQIHAVYEYSAGQNLCYKVTVQRFSWLLPLAKKWDSMVWAPTDVSCKQCRGTPKRSPSKSDRGATGPGS